MPVDYRDLAVEELADSEAALRAEIRTLVDLIADLAFENFQLRRAFQGELLERIHGDRALARCQRSRYKRPPSGTE